MKIEFIIPTYQRIDHLRTILCSLLAQTNPNWIAHVVGDCPPDNINSDIITFIRHLNDDRIRYRRLDKRYNDWGHTPRNYGLDNLLCEHSDLVVMTGEDNYYMPTFVENFLNEAKEPLANFFFCSFIHNQANMGKFYYPIKAQLEKGKIDIGCYAFRKFLSEGVRLDTKMMEADWQFIVDLVDKHGDIVNAVYLDETLYVHN